MLGSAATSRRRPSVECAVRVDPAIARGIRRVVWIVRIEDGVAAGIGLCTFTQAVYRTRTGNTIVKAVIRRRVSADRGNSRWSCGGRAVTSSGGWGSGTHRLAVGEQVGIAAIRGALARIKGFTRVQPARAGVRVGAAGVVEDNEAAGRVVVAVLPAAGPASFGDGEV